MTHLLLGGVSGWGKSINAQAWLERNLAEFDHAVILDYKDEYRGVVKAGLASWVGVDAELARLSVAGWQKLLQNNPRLVLARAVDVETWRTVANRVAAALLELDGSGLFAFDEAHFVASQRKGTPDRVIEVATTGRSMGVSSIAITQRLQKLDEDYLSQCNEKILGGFTSERDRKKLDVEYSVDVHNPERTAAIRGLPEELHADDDGPVPVRRWTNENGQTTGSEWIYSNDRGERQRLDTTGLPDRMETTHYGPEGQHLDMPEYA
ncbi:ATP-binding protein [Salarchaeum japonicum]|uniref:DNA helicase n=1 Tax=Salarchaeum japonicum TaxID=555573 RepID=A0AAV3SYR1_9EURY|nr:ATP-binding protein [Salarchaeum japonicum]